MIVVPNNGEIELLKRMFGQGIDASGVLKLCLIGDNSNNHDGGNNISITDSTTLAQLEAVEVDTGSGDTGSGGEDNYARIDLTDSLWVVSSSGDGIASYPQVTFTLNGGGDISYNVYGYFIIVHDGLGEVAGTNKQILWAEKFASALEITVSGGTVSITLKLELD